MKYKIWFNHIVNAYYVNDCMFHEIVEFDENSIQSFCCTDTKICSKCGNFLFASSFIEKIYEAHPTYIIDWKNYVKADKHNRTNRLQAIFEQAQPFYQLYLKEFLACESNFNGILLSGAKGSSRGHYFANSRQIRIRDFSVDTLFHEIGHAIMHLNSEVFSSFYEIFKDEGKQNSTQEILKAFLENKTKLGLKYDNCVASGYFDNLRSKQANMKYWEWFEAKLIASMLYSDVMDIFGAITGKKYTAYSHDVGHGKAYYRRTPPAEEFFAEYFSLCAVNELLQLDILRSAFPNTIVEYDRIIKILHQKYTDKTTI